jgi:heme exporter protein B
MIRAAFQIFKRDVHLSLRQSGGAGAALSFMLAFLVLVPLAIGPDLATLQRLAPGLMWLALLLSVLLTTERIFQQDYEDGSLDLLTLSPLPLEFTSLAKALGHWVSVSLPLAIVSPFLGLLLAIDAATIPHLLMAMVIGSLALSLLASIGGAITTGLRRGGLLVPLLILPLYVPVMIFGLSASQVGLTPSSSTSALLVLLALALVALVVQPWASAAALRAYLR